MTPRFKKRFSPNRTADATSSRTDRVTSRTLCRQIIPKSQSWQGRTRSALETNSFISYCLQLTAAYQTVRPACQSSDQKHHPCGSRSSRPGPRRWAAPATPRINSSWARKLERELSSTSFRFAYLIAHGINRVAGFAWRLHLHALLTKFACRTNRPTELESVPSEVARRRKNSNYYRMAWAAGRKPAPSKNPVGHGGRKCLRAETRSSSV
jgi:hypothetical protein